MCLGTVNACRHLVNIFLVSLFCTFVTRMWPSYSISCTCAQQYLWRHIQFCTIRVVSIDDVRFLSKEYSSHYIITKNSFLNIIPKNLMLFSPKFKMIWLWNAASRRCTCGKEKTWLPYIDNVLCLLMIEDKSSRKSRFKSNHWFTFLVETLKGKNINIRNVLKWKVYTKCFWSSTSQMGSCRLPLF